MKYGLIYPAAIYASYEDLVEEKLSSAGRNAIIARRIFQDQDRLLPPAHGFELAALMAMV